MKKREGVSLADLPEVLPPKANYNDIANQLGLERVPGVQIDPEKLMLDIGRMRVVSRAFGFGGIRLRRKQDEVTNDYQIDSITSISPSGAATGNASATRHEQPRGSSVLEDGYRKNRAYQRYSWPILNIEVGVQQIANNVAEQREPGVTPESLWAEELDAAFREALIKYVLRDKRWSIFMGDMQPDRYAFGRAMLASGSLVTSREISAEQITE